MLSGMLLTSQKLRQIIENTLFEGKTKVSACEMSVVIHYDTATATTVGQS